MSTETDRRAQDYMRDVTTLRDEVTKLKSRVAEIPMEEQHLLKDTEQAITELKRARDKQKDGLHREKDKCSALLRNKQGELDKVTRDLELLQWNLKR